MKRALITGITGQDGAYLADFLLKKGYKVYGTYRRLSTPNFWRLQYLGIFDNIELVPSDLIDSGSLVEALEASHPDEIYNLAAQSFVGASFEQPSGEGLVIDFEFTKVFDSMNDVWLVVKFYLFCI